MRLDKIGDLILTTPAIASLKATFPQSSLTAIVSSRNKAVLEQSPLVNECWEWKWNSGNIAKLKQKKFDQLIVFSPTTESYRIASLSGAGIRTGYVYASRPLVRFFSSFWLNRRLLCSVDQKDLEKNPREVPHEVEQNLDLIQFLFKEKTAIKKELCVPIPQEKKEWAKKKLRDRKWIGLHLSNAWLVDLPSNFLSSLLKELSERQNVFLTYGPQEARWASSLALPPNVERFGNTSFHEWGALLSQAAVCISTNTGAVHLAASQKVPVVAVFEKKFFAYHAQRWRPWEVPCAIVRKDDPNLLKKILESTAKLSDAKTDFGSNLQP